MDDEEYKRLKEIYKDHYRKINDMKRRLNELRAKERVRSALNNMNSDNLTRNFDDAMATLKEKVAITEARLSLALEQLRGESPEPAADPDEQEILRKEKARQTLETMKNSLGTLQADLEEKARNMKTVKTIGPKSNKDQTDRKETERNPDIG